MEALFRIYIPRIVAAILSVLAGTAIRTKGARRLAIVSLLGLIVVCAGIAAPALTMEDREVRAERRVLQLSQDIAALMSRDLSTIERRAALGDVLHRHIDIPLIARAVLGKAWRRASAAERRLYLKAFDRYMVWNLARYLGGTPGISLAVTGVATGGKKDAFVKTVISRAKGAPIKAVWRLRPSQAGPKVIDILIEGISLVLTKRDEFAAVIHRVGLAGLIDRLQVPTELTRNSRND